MRTRLSLRESRSRCPASFAYALFYPRDVIRALSFLVALAGCRACDEKKAPRDAAPQCLAPRAPITGQATHYDADGKGNCSFDVDPSRMVAAVNGTDYATAAWCGACVEVTGPQGTVVVRIVDQCPGCAQGDLDLSREAFAKIAALDTGRVAITWREVACDVIGPIAYRFKDGSSQHWTGIQVRNHRYAIASLEAREPDGSYRAIGRLPYNYFVTAKGLGVGPYTLRITDSRGQVVEDPGIELGDSVERSGVSQFPACPN